MHGAKERLCYSSMLFGSSMIETDRALCLMQSAFKDTPDVKEFLFNPMVEEKKKRDLMKSLADDAGLSKHTLNFMYLLLDQGRLFSIAEIFDQFEIQYCKLTDTQVRVCAARHLHSNAQAVCVCSAQLVAQHQSILMQMIDPFTFVSSSLCERVALLQSR